MHYRSNQRPRSGRKSLMFIVCVPFSDAPRHYHVDPIGCMQKIPTLLKLKRMSSEKQHRLRQTRAFVMEFRRCHFFQTIYGLKADTALKLQVFEFSVTFALVHRYKKTLECCDVLLPLVLGQVRRDIVRTTARSVNLLSIAYMNF